MPFFYNYGVNTIVLHNQLRNDGCVAEVDAFNDAQQAIQYVRAYAKDWRIDPNKIGIMGFSAGAELAAQPHPTRSSTKRIRRPEIRLRGFIAQPDFVFQDLSILAPHHSQGTGRRRRYLKMFLRHG